MTTYMPLYLEVHPYINIYIHTYIHVFLVDQYVVENLRVYLGSEEIISSRAERKGESWNNYEENDESMMLKMNLCLPFRIIIHRTNLSTTWTNHL